MQLRGLVITAMIWDLYKIVQASYPISPWARADIGTILGDQT